MILDELDLSTCPNLKTIEENVFLGAKINTLDFSVCKNLEEIGGGAFINFQTDNNTLDFSTNSKLNRFPANTVFSIGTFSKYNGHVILPKALESLSYCLFAEFQGSVEFPAGIKSIGHRAFYNAKPSKPLIFHENIEVFENSAFAGIILDALDLSTCPNLKTIGENVFSNAKINSLDFSVCKNLEEIGGGTFINFQTDNNTLDFSTNSKLNRFPANTVFSIGTFSKYNGHVILPKALESLSYCLFAEFQGSVEFPAGIKSIGHRAFYNAKPSKPLIFHENIEVFENNAFEGIIIDELDLSTCPNLKTIGEYVFANAQIKLLDFSVCKNLEEIGGGTFINFQTDNNTLDFSTNSKLNLPARNIYYGIGTFSKYNGHVILPKVLESLSYCLFAEFQGSVELPAGLKSIKRHAFYRSTIKEIILPASVISIDNSVFQDCKNLTEIQANSLTPPTLGENVFLNVDKANCSLIVRRASADLYASANQWKDFLNIENSKADGEDLTFIVHENGTPRSTESYTSVRIGEYMWINNNLRNVIPGTGQYQGWEKLLPMSQSYLDTYMPCIRMSPSQYQVNIEDFVKYYGIYYHQWSMHHVRKEGTMYEKDGSIQEGWDIPTAADAQQLFGMCDVGPDGALSHLDVFNDLLARVGDNPMAYNMGTKPYWCFIFNPKNSNSNRYGFNLMPGGARLQKDDTWENGLGPLPGGAWQGKAGDIYHLFYAAGFWTQESYAYIHDNPDSHNGFSWKLYNIRLRKKLTDEELGYKLYVNKDYTDIVKLDLSAEAPVGYEELPNGYVRGFYVQYILDNPNTTVTVKDVVDYARKVTDTTWSMPATGETKAKIANASTSIEQEATENKVSVYPNPAESELKIYTTSVANATMFNMTGNKVMSFNKLNAGENTVDISTLGSGIYLLKVSRNNKVYDLKVVVK